MCSIFVIRTAAAKAASNEQIGQMHCMYSFVGKKADDGVEHRGPRTLGLGPALGRAARAGGSCVAGARRAGLLTHGSRGAGDVVNQHVDALACLL